MSSTPRDDIDRAIADLARVGTDDLQDEFYKRKIKAQIFGNRVPPRRVGRFLALDELGRGGMGTVLRAYDDALDRQIAVKLMHASMRERHAARILREAQALARLSHPNVVQVYEVGEADDQMFIAMELVRGQTLRQWQEQPHPWRERLEAYLQAGRGLAAAHAEGLVHRDFKPANCIRDAKGRVRVLDFGLATEAGDSGEERASPYERRSLESMDALPNGSPNALGSRLTETGSILGTRAFMAPEQLLKQPADARSDQFSFCVALFEALYGQRPYDDIAMTMREAGHGETLSLPPVSPVAGSSVPRRLHRALARGLALQPQERWPSMDALLLELERAGRSPWARRAPWAVASISVLSLALAGLWPSRVPSCEDAHQRLSHVWDAEQRERAREAVLATNLPYAADTWATAEHEIDVYAEEWMHQATAACEATKIHHEQSLPELRLRERCLERSRTALAHDVELLTTADPQVVDNAVKLVAQLPRLDQCADLEALARTAGPERSAALEQEAEELRGQISLARSFHTTGKHQQGLRTIAPVVARAEQLDDPALWAETMVVEGELHLQAGDDERGQALLQRAHTMALEHGADEVAIEAMSNLIYLLGVDQASSEVGLSLGATAEALAARYDRGGLLHAKVLTSVAQVLTQRGELSRARDHYQRALEILREVRGPADVALVEALDGLAQVLRKQGELEQAEALYRRALSIRTAKLGARHTETAHLMVNLGVVLGARGAYREAEQQYRGALEILEEALAPDNRRIAPVHSNLGALLSHQGRHAEAEAEMRTAARIWELAHGPEHPWVAAAYFNLAVELESQGRIEEAIVQAKRALDIWRKRSTPEDAERTAQTLRELGNYLVTLGRDDEAESHYREALGVATHSLGSDDPMVASILNRLGRLLTSRMGDAAEAELMHRRALAIYESALGPEHLKVGHTLRDLGKVLATRRQWAAARDSLDRALAIYATHGDEAKPEQVADAELALAEVLWRLSERTSAIQMVTRAIERIPAADPIAQRGRTWLDAHGEP